MVRHVLEYLALCLECHTRRLLTTQRQRHQLFYMTGIHVIAELKRNIAADDPVV